jgi:hypothetical protein
LALSTSYSGTGHGPGSSEDRDQYLVTGEDHPLGSPDIRTWYETFSLVCNSADQLINVPCSGSAVGYVAILAGPLPDVRLQSQVLTDGQIRCACDMAVFVAADVRSRVMTLVALFRAETIMLLLVSRSGDQRHFVCANVSACSEC